MEESLKTFPFWELTFFKKVKLLYFGRVTFESGPSKGVNVLAIFRYVVKKIEVFSEGKIEKGIFCFRVCFRKINILVES